MRWHNLIWSTALLLSFVVSSDSRIQDSERLLTAADRFAMLYNWPEAAPLYAEAETLFTHSGDRKNALHARLGYLWAQADSGVTPEALAGSQRVSSGRSGPIGSTTHVARADCESRARSKHE